MSNRPNMVEEGSIQAIMFPIKEADAPAIGPSMMPMMGYIITDNSMLPPPEAGPPIDGVFQEA